MPHASIVDRVRLTIRETCLRLGAARDGELSESILIREGYYCGRRFHYDGMQAVWFIEENQIKFFGRDGALLQVTDLTDERPSVERRRAA